MSLVLSRRALLLAGAVSLIPAGAAHAEKRAVRPPSAPVLVVKEHIA